MSDTMPPPTATSAAVAQPQEAPPPIPNRRPRVREVSSRFMNSTPLVVSAGAGDLHTSQQHPLKTPRHIPSTPLQRSKTDQPHHHHHHPETVVRRSFSDSPLTLYNHNNRLPPTTKRGASTKLLFKENNGGAPGGGDNDCNDAVFSSKTAKSLSSSSRPDTPIIGTQRIVPSRFRQTNNNLNSASAAAKLLHSSGLSLSAQEHLGDVKASGSNSDDDEDRGSSKSCPNSPLCVQNNLSNTWSGNSNVRSSMPDTRSNNVGDSNLNSKIYSASPCSRSLNLQNTSVKMMGLNLSLPPPHPLPLTKPGDAARKGKKVSSHQEQVHSLKMLHNHYLQWSFANAKSQATLRAQTRDAEGKLYSLGVKISEMSEVVRRKRMELGLLRRIKTLTEIVETQMPYLDEWSVLEEEHSSSLSGTTDALVNTLVRLPVGGNVQADTREVGEALNSALKVMDMIHVQVQKFIPKANYMDTLSSELARSLAGERVLVEECGDLIFKTYTSQVEDCSLRGHLMQLKKSNSRVIPPREELACHNGEPVTEN